LSKRLRVLFILSQYKAPFGAALNAGKEEVFDSYKRWLLTEPAKNTNSNPPKTKNKTAWLGPVLNKNRSRKLRGLFQK
jgi:hypothetical protein